MESMRGQDFVHALMVKLNRVSIAAILAVVAIYGLVTYQGTPAPATHGQGSGTSGAAHFTPAIISGCSNGNGNGSASNDSWPLPVRGPR